MKLNAIKKLVKGDTIKVTGKSMNLDNDTVVTFERILNVRSASGGNMDDLLIVSLSNGQETTVFPNQVIEVVND